MRELKMNEKRLMNSIVLSNSTQDNELGTSMRSNSNKNSGGNTSVHVRSEITTLLSSTFFLSASFAFSSVMPEPLELGKSTVVQFIPMG